MTRPPLLRVVSKTGLLILSATVGLLLGGCLSDSPSENDTSAGVNAPTLTMDLPVSLSGVIAGGTAGKAGQIMPRAVQDPNECAQYFDANANPYGSGYHLARFLVGLSQSQTCFADFLMGMVVSNADLVAGQGLLSIPADPNDPGAPSHYQVERSGDTYQVWLYFGTHGQTPDTTTVPAMYLTWTGTGTDVTGKFLMVRVQNGTNPDPNGPDSLRVDFERTASTAVNRIYLDFADTAGQSGFRVDVSRTGTGIDAIYEVQGLMEFPSQPAADYGLGLPPTEEFGIPKVTVVAAVDDSGAGAAEWGIKDFAFHIAVDENGDWDYSGANEFNVGSYKMTVADKSYFDATGTISWQARGVDSANYVNTSTGNTRVGAGATSYLSCMESVDGCDYNSDGTIDIPGFGLGSGYFTDTCTDADGADCTAMMQGYYDMGAFDPLMGGVSVANSAAAEPTSATATQLATLLGLSSIHPDDDPTGLMTFDLPAAP